MGNLFSNNSVHIPDRITGDVDQHVWNELGRLSSDAKNHVSALITEGKTAAQDLLFVTQNVGDHLLTTSGNQAIRVINQAGDQVIRVIRVQREEYEQVARNVADLVETKYTQMLRTTANVWRAEVEHAIDYTWKRVINVSNHIFMLCALLILIAFFCFVYVPEPALVNGFLRQVYRTVQSHSAAFENLAVVAFLVLAFGVFLNTAMAGPKSQQL